MNRVKFSLIICAVLTLSNASHAGNIDVLIGATPEAIQNQNAFSAAADLATKMPLIMLNNGMPGNVYRFGAYPLAVNYQEAGPRPSADAVNYVRNLSPIDPFFIARTFTPIPVLPVAVVTGFDIQVLLVSTMLPNSGNSSVYSCGATYTNTNLLDIFGQVQFSDTDRNTYYVVVLSLDSRCRQDLSLEAAFMHEMGHVKGGRHQNPSSIQVSHARPFEHTPTSGPNQYTAMRSPWDMGLNQEVYSSKSLPFPNSPVIRGTSSRDMVRFVGERWNHVAAYRPIPPPPTISHCVVTLLTCTGNTSTNAITGYINEAYPITNIRLETRLSPSQPWLPGYEGSYTCPAHGSTTTWFWQLFIETAYGTAMCPGQVYVNPWNGCGEEEGGW